MDKQCAACLGPITSATPFALAGTEVFHVACVKAGGIVRSVGNRRKQRLIELRAEIDQLRIDQAQVVQLREQLKRHDRDHERMIEAERAVARLTRQAAEGEMREAEYRRQREEARRERDAANAAAEAARRELQLERELRRGVPVSQAPAATTATEGSSEARVDDGKDATEKRFSLLELD
jgi:hypothetical protein